MSTTNPNPGPQQRFHVAVEERSRGECEALVAPGCWQRKYGRTDRVQAHHVVPRGRGVGWRWLNNASRNGLACCPVCHDHIHNQMTRKEQVARCVLLPRPFGDEDPGPILERVEAARKLSLGY